MAMTYPQFLALHGMHPTAVSALAWLRSGQAPMGTPIPAALQPQMGGSTTVLAPQGTYNVPLMPGQTAAPFNPLAGAPPGTPAVPAGVLPPVQNPYQPQLDDILRQAMGLGAAYNPQRHDIAAATAASLSGSGLVDYGLQAPTLANPQGDYTTVLGEKPNAFGGTVGDKSYGIVHGADGRAYLQAFTNVAHAGASRGVFSGSQVEAQQGQARMGLDTQRANAMTGMQGQQQGVDQAELGRLGTLGSNYADYQSKGAVEAPKTVGGWSVTPSVPASGPSPLTQLTGGQNTVTGGTGGTGVKAQKPSPIGKGAGGPFKLTSGSAKTYAGAKALSKGGLTTTKLGF